MNRMIWSAFIPFSLVRMGNFEPVLQRLVRALKDRAGDVREAIAGL
jgi:hypothetical protein